MPPRWWNPFIVASTVAAASSSGCCRATVPILTTPFRSFVNRNRAHAPDANRGSCFVSPPRPPRPLHAHLTSASASRLALAPQQLGEFEHLNVYADDADRISHRRVALKDLVTVSETTTTSTAAAESPLTPYDDAWEMQKRLLESHLNRVGKRPSDPPLRSNFLPPPESSDDDDAEVDGCDTIIMLQHEPVFTLGTASDPSFIRDSNVRVVRIERGGEVTYHGPGQLVVYPILDLRGYQQDIHWYMRALEETIIIALEKAGVAGATREDDLTGVWVSGKKIAAVGIKARRWVTMHGLAVNIDRRSLSNFDGIVPCGLIGREVTCVADEISEELTLETFAGHMREALEEVFEVHLVPRGEG